jgi:hypothetical protein
MTTLHMMSTPTFIAYNKHKIAENQHKHSWVLDPNYIKAQVEMARKATWPAP